MKRSCKGTARFAVLLLLMLMVSIFGFAAAESSDNIRVSSLSEPQSVISEQDVSITIKIYNSGQQDMQETITLFNPEGMQVEKYEGLGAEQSVTYTGTWHVTSAQIAEGKIKYYIRYSINGQDSTRTIPITIQTEEAAPQLIANYAVSPASARQGQQMNIAYTLSNTGNIGLRDITIRNPGISESTLIAASLAVGERIVLEDTFTMGSTQMICEPQITYRSVDSDKVLTVPDMTRRTLAPAQDGLEITLDADHTENIYPGEKVSLSVKLKNTGDSSYVGLQIRLSDDTEIASDIELAAGASYESSIDWTPMQSTEITAIVSGMDAEGDPITIGSAPLIITTQDASMALILDVQAAAQTDTIYSEPAVVLFALRVTNISEMDATTLTVTEAGTTVATIPSLPAGEYRQLVFELETSIAGKIQFAVTGKDAAGNDRTYLSNVLTLSYIEPTPTPAPTSAPTAVPPTPSPVPTATPEPTLVEFVTGLVEPTVLYIIAGVLAALILLIIIISSAASAGRRRRLAQAIDSFTLAPDTRDSTGRSRKKKNNKKPEKKSSNKIVSTDDLTEDDILPKSNAAPQRQQAAETAQDDDAHRRRAGHADLQAEADSSRPDPTLRVAPMDRRPEYPQARTADKSKTRVFSRNRVRDDSMPEETKRVQPSGTSGTQSGPDETIRIERDQAANVRQSASTAESAKAPEKEKKHGLFGRKKNNDLLDDEEYFE